MHFNWLRLTLLPNEILHEIYCFMSLLCSRDFFISLQLVTYLPVFGLGKYSLVLLKHFVVSVSYVKFFHNSAPFICRYFRSLRMQIMLKDAGCVMKHHGL